MVSKLVEITLPTSLKDALNQGHPWVYRNHVPSTMHLPSGEWVKVRCGGWTGYGLWDNRGPIALRIFSRKQLPDRAWMERQIVQAWDLRAPLRAQGCTAYRWLYGEGDGLPGITVDLYDQYAVIQTYFDEAKAVLENLLVILPRVTPLQGILFRSPPSKATELEELPKVQLLWGKLPPATLTVLEHGLKFQVNLPIGQKTGLFLDHRENRKFVEGLCAGKKVLNCFAYTGAFSLYALRSGAKTVVSVDVGKGLAEAAAANVRLNGFDADRHQFITADCFDTLQQFDRAQNVFDVIILDPPSFAKSKQNRFAAIRAYTKLNALALRCLSQDGLLVTASCTSQIGPEAFREMVSQALAQADRRGQIIHEAGHALDHPVPVGFPEGRYLKFLVIKVSNYL